MSKKYRQREDKWECVDEGSKVKSLSLGLWIENPVLCTCGASSESVGWGVVQSLHGLLGFRDQALLGPYMVALSHSAGEGPARGPASPRAGWGVCGPGEVTELQFPWQVAWLCPCISVHPYHSRPAGEHHCYLFRRNPWPWTSGSPCPCRF